MAIWKGAISFGLVNIPVSLVSAEESGEEIHFSLLDKKDHSPIGYNRINKRTGKQVSWGDIVKGYEYDRDNYVIITDQDLKRANVKATELIEIEDFVEEDEIPITYFEKPYYLEPTKSGRKSYALLREALQKSRRVGIAKIVIRTRQRLAAVMVEGEAIMLEIMRFPYEIRSPQRLNLPDKEEVKLNPREVEMAVELVERMSADFNPKKYHDTYHDDLLKTIQRKIRQGETEEIQTPAEEEEKQIRARGAVVDLMPLLMKSLEQKRKASSESSSKKKTRSRHRDQPVRHA